MHSSRICTVRFSGRLGEEEAQGVCVCVSRGVSAQGDSDVCPGEVCPEGVCPEGFTGGVCQGVCVCVSRGVYTTPPARCRLAYTHSPVNRMTDRCKNITLPQTSFAGGKNNSTI